MNASEQPDQEWLQGTAPEIPDLEPFFLEQDEGGRRTAQLVHGRGVADQEQLMRLRGGRREAASRSVPADAVVLDRASLARRIDSLTIAP